MTQKRIVLGMSGGTDSSVSAMILKNEGYEVIGVSLWMYGENKNNKNNLPDFIIDAEELANKLGIKFLYIDAREEFKNRIIKNFVGEYLNGRTPSPCIECNPTIKWKLLLDYADEIKADHIATGHYINIEKHDDGLYYIHKGICEAKDQSYFMWKLGQEFLSRIICPLGNFTKDEVRAIAIKNAYPKIAKKKESMGICFVNNIDYRDYLKNFVPDIDEKIGEGNIYNTKGEKIGTHDGFPYYTIGQKRGLNLIKKEGLLVSKIDSNNNSLILDKRDNLMQKNIDVSNYSFINIDLIKRKNIRTIIRGIGLNPEAYSTITIIDKNKLSVRLDNPAWAIAPGQPVAFYIEDILIGGGIAE